MKSEVIISKRSVNVEGLEQLNFKLIISEIVTLGLVATFIGIGLLIVIEELVKGEVNESVCIMRRFLRQSTLSLTAVNMIIQMKEAGLFVEIQDQDLLNRIESDQLNI